MTQSTVTQQVYTEDMPLVMQFRIDKLITTMQTAQGMAKLAAIREYAFKAELYNNIVGFPCYHLKYMGTKETEY